MSFSSQAILLPIIIIFIYYLIKSHKPPSEDRKAKQQLPPGPKPWPVIGCLPAMLTNKPTFRWINNLMKQMDTEIACVRIGNVHVIPVSCPKISCEFLKAQDSNFATRPITMSTRVTSKGYLTTVLTPYGDQWKKMKRILVTQMLSPAKQLWFSGKRVEGADHLVRYVYKQCSEGGLVDVRIAARHYCGNVIRKMVFNKRFFGKGKKNGGPGFEEAEHVDALFRILDYSFSFCLSDYLPCLEGFDLGGHEKIIKEANGIIGKYHDPIIEDRVQQWKDGTKKEEEDLLDVLITLKDDNGNPLLSTDEIKAQITLVQEKPFASTLFRHSIFLITDTTLENYYIPKGSHALLSRVGLGRNPKVWDEPHKFKPERHIKNDGSGVTLTEPDLRFISFSTGRRGCAGVTMGTSITLMLFARLLQGFTWNVPRNETSIDLKESESDLTLAKPLVLLAKPRLPAFVYDQIMHDN
ncbi:hypothetical protein JCGZ_17299 [Jatropha curcas]|uniref:Cytochrome P450 n=1 Tax=Jatropha curcas TaxID=180498 RepID=A0A067LBC2_JATCU|nr:hypothetical protein JCGZ_17299 [Jatropha curcas]